MEEPEEVNIDNLNNNNYDMDMEWISDVEKDEELYQYFYMKEPDATKIILTYVDDTNNIISCKKFKEELEFGILKKEQLIKILNENMNFNNKKYRPISMLKWNINIPPKSIKNYILDDKDFNFITIEPEIKDITFEKTISNLSDINTLYIFFHESWKSYNNRSKKIYIKKNKLKRKKQTKRLK